MEPPIIGSAYHNNGVTLHVHDFKNGEVYLQRFPKGVETQGMFENLMRVPLDHFEKESEGAEIEAPNFELGERPTPITGSPNTGNRQITSLESTNENQLHD